MKIGGCDSVNAFSIGDWKKMAGKSGLGWPMMRERMAENSRAVLDKLESVRERTREYGEEMTGRLRETIGSRSSRMIAALSRSEQ